MQDDFNGKRRGGPERLRGFSKRPGSPGRLRGFCVRDAVLAVAALLVLSAFALGGAPAWWAARGVTDPARAANDFAPVNQGQLETQVYPSYRIYINGELKSTVDQAASPWPLFPNTDRCR